MARDKTEHNYSDDEFDFDEEYFARTYRPLSNLPTPPPSSHNTSGTGSPRCILEHGELLGSALLGPAVHLVNLIPPSASLAIPSVPFVHEILSRANLPLETIALAVCILDSLDSRFALNWRLVCPLMSFQAHAKRHTIQTTVLANDQLHIDSVRPELIIFTALVIAVKFLEDGEGPTQHYSSHWGQDTWTCEQINVTERCIVENLGYRILPLWDRELIDDALADMGRAAADQSMVLKVRPRSKDDPHKRSMSSGVAVTGLALHFTPAETPRSEVAAGGLVPSWVGDEVRAAFMGGSPAALTCDSLQLSPEGRMKNLSLADGDAGGTTLA